MFNREAGKIELNAEGLHRLRQMAKITGTSFEELSQSAINLAKETQIEGKLGFDITGAQDAEAMIAKVTGSAYFSKDLNDWVVNIGDQVKSIRELTKEDVIELNVATEGGEQDVFKRLIEVNEDIKGLFERFFQEIKVRTFDPNNQQRVERVLEKEISGMQDKGIESTGLGSVMGFIQKMQTGVVDRFEGFFDRMRDFNFNGLITVTESLMGIVEAGAKVFDKFFDSMLSGAEYLATDFTASAMKAGAALKFLSSLNPLSPDFYTENAKRLLGYETGSEKMNKEATKRFEEAKKKETERIERTYKVKETEATKGISEPVSSLDIQGRLEIQKNAEMMSKNFMGSMYDGGTVVKHEGTMKLILQNADGSKVSEKNVNIVNDNIDFFYKNAEMSRKFEKGGYRSGAVEGGIDS